MDGQGRTGDEAAQGGIGIVAGMGRDELDDAIALRWLGFMYAAFPRDTLPCDTPSNSARWPCLMPLRRRNRRSIRPTGRSAIMRMP
jgi:hypothetical protein